MAGLRRLEASAAIDRTGKPIGPPLDHAAPVIGARFLPGGTEVVTVGLDGRVRLWPIDPPDPADPAALRTRVEVETGLWLDTATGQGGEIRALDRPAREARRHGLAPSG